MIQGCHVENQVCRSDGRPTTHDNGERQPVRNRSARAAHPRRPRSHRKYSARVDRRSETHHLPSRVGYVPPGSPSDQIPDDLERSSDNHVPGQIDEHGAARGASQECRENKIRPVLLGRHTRSRQICDYYESEFTGFQGSRASELIGCVLSYLGAIHGREHPGEHGTKQEDLSDSVDPDQQNSKSSRGFESRTDVAEA